MRTVYAVFVIFIFTFSSGIFARSTSDSVDIWSLSLDEILNLKVVAAQKTERELNRTPASVIVLTRKDIQRYGCISLEDVLNLVPGLYLWNGYHVRGRINIGIRGYTSSDNVIILVNGVNQVEGVYNEYLLSKVAVPVEAIDRIEVVRGPMSVLYGNGAFFGVINIITNALDEGSKNSVSLAGGSNKYIKGTAKVSIVEHELKMGLTASGFYTEGLNQPYSEMMSDPSLLNNWGLTEESTTEGMLKDQNRYFNVSMKYKGLTTDFTHTEVERGGFLVQPTIQYSPTKRHSTNFMTSYRHELGKRLSLMGKFSYLTSNALAFYFLNEEDSYLSFGYNSDAYEAELLSFIQPWDNLEITLGLFHRNVYYATNPAELSAAWGAPYGLHLTRLSIDSRMIENSAFTQIDLSLGKKIDLIGGLRLQQMLPFHYDASGGAPYPSQGRQVYTDTYKFEKLYFIPSLSFLYAFNERHILKLLYGQALRNPPLGIIADILFSTADDETFDYPQLIPSEIRTYEINYNGIMGPRLSLHASVFRNELKNLITQYFITLTDSTTVYYSSNKGRINTHGIEVSVMCKPVNSLTLNLSVAYQHSEDKTEGIEHVDVAYSPNLLGYAQLSWVFLEKWSVFVNGRYVSSMLPEYDYEKRARLGNETPAFMEFDGGIMVRNLGINGLCVKLYSKNITNQKIYYPVTTLNQFADEGLLGFPRRFFIGVKYEF